MNSTYKLQEYQVCNSQSETELAAVFKHIKRFKSELIHSKCQFFTFLKQDYYFIWSECLSKIVLESKWLTFCCCIFNWCIKYFPFYLNKKDMLTHFKKKNENVIQGCKWIVHKISWTNWPWHLTKKSIWNAP
jgi:hypothetical protein